MNGSKRTEEIIAFYNVENLFPPDPPVMHYLDPTPSGLKNWDERKYQVKLRKIAEVFHLISLHKGQSPLFIGLSEIQGEQPLQDLLAKDVFKEYAFVRNGNLDRRGMGVYLLYQKKRIQLISSETLDLAVGFEVDTSEEISARSILKCKFLLDSAVFNVLLLHLPSQRDNNVKIKLRTHILKALKEEITKIDKEEAVIMMGDFNVNPDDENIAALFYQNQNRRCFNNPFLPLYTARQFSAYHQRGGLLFDQIMFSEEFYDNRFPMQFSGAEVFSHPRLRAAGRKFAARPARTYAGTRYIGGYSDHFPVLASFIRN